MKKLLWGLLAILLLGLISGCSKKVNISKEELIYKNNKLGFSLVFPESWKDKYRIEENEMGITVYFKPKEKVEDGYGELFSIIKKSDDLDEKSFDTIGEHRYFEAKGNTYIIGGPTDLSFPEEHSGFKTFLKMNGERIDVLKTLEIID